MKIFHEYKLLPTVYTTEIILQGFNNKLEIIDNRKDGESSSYSSYDSHEDSVSGIEDDIPF